MGDGSDLEFCCENNLYDSDSPATNRLDGKRESLYIHLLTCEIVRSNVPYVMDKGIHQVSSYKLMRTPIL